MMDINEVVSNLEKNYILKLLKQGKRIDGRGLFEYRDVKIKTGFIPKAEGSADVFLGDTRVMCGVKYDIGTPFSDNPDKGVCTVMSEYLPIASPMFEPGRPDEVAIQLARVVDRGIRHTNCIDYKKLCIKEGEYVYILFVDCYMMDYFGNLTDASAIAAIAALLNTNLPGAKLNEEGVPEWDGTYSPLTIYEIPLSISFGKVGNVIFVDPNLSEEMVLDGSIAFAVDEKKQVTSIQKYGNATWSVEEILDTSKKAIEIADELRAKLNLRQHVPQPK
ncbi:MAG: exosome complex protein Rrp42 [Candidatus Lokiarchaeota archaeon]|nr:exosome complex protein Rrp42 [Candidatus Harpocratesius repetitus]